MIYRDKNGNLVADVVGGPDDGGTFFCRDRVDGDTFTPMRTSPSDNRPLYLFKGGCFTFLGWSIDPNCEISDGIAMAGEKRP